MTERREGIEPQASSREIYFDKTQEFFQVFKALDGAVARARNDQDSNSFFRFNLAKVRMVNDFEWMQTCEDAGIPADQFNKLLGKKQDKKIAEERIKYYDAIKDFSEEPLGEEPLEKTYLEMSENLIGIRGGIEEAKQQGDSGKYLNLRRTREEIHSDFEWMETCREAGMPHDQVLKLYTKKEERKKAAAEHAVFEGIIQASENANE